MLSLDVHRIGVVRGGDGRVLFDTGQGNALPPNVDRLGVPLERTDALVLSHGHYDHTGGFPYVLERAPSVDVWFHPGATVQRFSIRRGTAKNIGMPPAAEPVLAAVPAPQAHRVDGAARLSDTIGLTAYYLEGNSEAHPFLYGAEAGKDQSSGKLSTLLAAEK